MQNMFKDKGGQTTKSKPAVEIKTDTALVNMVDVNVTAKSKTSEEHVFKNQKPRRINLHLIGKLKRS